MARTSRKGRSRRRRGRSWMPVLELPQLDQREWDLIGLALVAFAAFFASVFYLGWSGGEVGEALADAILYLFGGVGYAAPVALFAAGALIMLGPVLPAVHPFKTGALCLLCALCLGFAAGSLGLGPGDAPRDGFLDPSYLREHGGLFGESLYWVVSTLFSDVGAHLLFAFLLLAGVLLLTGASVAGVLTSTHRAATTTGERVRRSTHGLATAFGGEPTVPLPATRRAPERELDDDEPEPVQPPEPEDSEPVVRATHVEAPALDASERYPDLFGDDEPELEEVADEDWDDEQPELPDLLSGAAEEVEAEEELEDEPVALTPRGNKRSPVTEADDVVYKLPKPTFLTRSNGAQKHGHQGHRARGPAAGRGAQPLQRRGARRRHRQRAARHALRAAPGAGNQDVEGRPAQGRPRLRAGRRARAHPGADPRQAGGRRRGAQPRAQDGPPRRRLPGRAGQVVAADGLAGQGHRRQGDRHRPRQAAARARRRHHRRRQVRLRQRDAVLDPAARGSERGAHGAGRPQARRAQPLRGHPAPADPGDHQPAAGRQRAREPDQGDGGALRDHEPRQDAQPGRAQPRARRAKGSSRCPTSSA